MPGFSSSISQNIDCVFASNADFSSSSNNNSPLDPKDTNGLQQDLQIWVGSSALNPGGTHVNVMALTAGTGVTLTQNAFPVSTVVISSAGSVPLTFHTDSGDATPAANAITIHGGTNINTSGVGSTVTVNLDDPVLQQNDSAAAPSYSFANATSTGLYLYDAGISGMALAAGGGDKILINAFNIQVQEDISFNDAAHVGSRLTLSHIIVSTTPYVSLANSVVYDVDTSALAITIQLPNSPNNGEWFIVKDYTGSAATRNITVTTPGGTVLFDGATTNVISTNYGASQYIFNSTTGNYEVIAQLGTDLHTARYIVSAGGMADGANYTTIATAYAAAVAKGGVQTVFIQPGSYTENLTLSPNVNLTAYVCDYQTPTVTIIGKLTMTAAGSASVSGINLQTNSDNIISVTGANAVVLNIVGCFLSITNNTGIAINNTNAKVRVLYCQGNITTTGIAIYSVTSVSTLRFNYTHFLNDGASTTASSVAAGEVELWYTRFKSPISTSSTGFYSLRYAHIHTTTENAVSLTTAGSGTSDCFNSDFRSGSAAAISIGTGTTVSLWNAIVDSTNAAVISGLGTLNWSTIAFANTGSVISATTQVPFALSNNTVQVTVPGAYPYTTLAQDYVIIVDTTSARTITPLASPKTGQTYRIKDNTGTAGSNNITVTPSGKNIDGAASHVINTNFGSIDIVFNGTQWNVV